ncbi:MAG: TetR/AcrR family transcriptional regulator [Gammaproteobacteria bacterium]|nr:TetR/AcrR family transcriptional regulator [Gammaproteobacteria bacterium]
MNQAIGWKQRSAEQMLGRTRKNAEARTLKIVDAAIEQITESGLSGFTVQAVLGRCGLALSTFYSRFSGKDDLMLAVYEETIHRSSKDLSNMLDGVDGSPVDRLRVLVRFQMEGSLRSKSDNLITALKHEYNRLADERPEQLEFVMRPLHELIASQIQLGQQAGLIRDADPLNCAVMIRSLITTSTLYIPAALTRESEIAEFIEKAAEEVWDFCWHAIKR